MRDTNKYDWLPSGTHIPRISKPGASHVVLWTGFVMAILWAAVIGWWLH
jgi:hypothetical protein